MSRSARLGAFILGTLVLLATGVFIIGSKQYLFTRTYQLKTSFANVVGLSAGADVLVGGVHSGTVRSIQLPEKSSGQVSVILQMDAATRNIIKQDSVASIQTEGLLGNEYVAVSFGSDDKPKVNDGDTIASQPPLEMNALLDKANGLLGQGQQAMDNINQVAAHLNSVTGKIDHGNGTVGALVNDKELYNNLNQTASSAHTAVVSAQAGVASFNDDMQALKHNFLLRGFFKDRGYEDSSDLGKNEVAGLPQATAIKEFTLQAKDLFDKRDTAKLKGQKRLNPAGQFLADNDFGVAIIRVSTGASGSSDDSLTLAEGRALVVRDYIVQHYGFDDTHLKTVSVGKQPGETSKDDWGLIKILVYPPDTPVPADKKQESSPAAAPSQPPSKPSN